MPQQSNPIANLWRWDGTVDRKTYALVGIIGLAIKHNIDRYVARNYFSYSNVLFNYWAPLGKAARLSHLSSAEKQLLLTLLVIAMPFICVGVAFTLRRLRDASQPLWLVCLFFVPFLNLVFFLILCFLPSQQVVPSNVAAAPWPHVRSLNRIIPRGKLGIELISVFLTTAIGLFFLRLGIAGLASYGWSLFVALPFCMGVFSVLLYSYHEPRSFASSMEVSLMPVLILGAVIVGLAMEGIICVMMAAPIALFLAFLGGGVGFFIQAHYWGPRTKPAILSAILLVLPAAFFGEHAAVLQPSVYAVRSVVTINAPPDKVWNDVVAFAEILPPKELLFRAGIAYPVRAEIDGAGVGATRRCIFSTGAFEEPITVWDQPHLLKFSVAKNPAPLTELSPYGHIQPLHLHGYFISHGGQFQLTALAGGKTRLEGTTWYHHTMWPATYWHWWSAYVIHRVHLRVLNHIREQAETTPAQAFAAAAVSSTR
jgi:uncharacterized membrane protein YhaH (DUF805 family)